MQYHDKKKYLRLKLEKSNIQFGHIAYLKLNSQNACINILYIILYNLEYVLTERYFCTVDESNIPVKLKK